MSIKLRKQVISILKILKEREENLIAGELAQELNLDYIVLMSAINDLIEYNLAGFKEKEINKVSLNEEGKKYLKEGLPERKLLQLLIKNDVKEIPIKEFLKKSKFARSMFYIGLSNMKKNKWIAESKATGENKVFLIADQYPETKLETFLKKFEKNPS
ncbi:MAG: hypothetical protein ACFFBH_13245, partial [Promethearchaeota archaeon]